MELKEGTNSKEEARQGRRMMGKAYCYLDGSGVKVSMQGRDRFTRGVTLRRKTRRGGRRWNGDDMDWGWGHERRMGGHRSRICQGNQAWGV